MIKKRLNIRMSGLGGQGAVTAAHVLAMAANRDGKFSISNPFFGAEKRMAPAESYCRIGIERIYDRGELVFPDVIQVFHPQVITMGKSYTMPFYSGVKEGGVVIINSAQPLLSEEDIQRLKDLNVALFYIAGTELAIEAVDALDAELFPIFQEEAQELLPQAQDHNVDLDKGVGYPCNGKVNQKSGTLLGIPATKDSQNEFTAKDEDQYERGHIKQEVLVHLV